MMSLLLAVVGASFLGSPHCAGMCGGFVAFYAAGSSGRRRLLPHVTYNGGRLVSYTILGALCGALGAALDHAGAFAGIQSAAAVISGSLIALWGVHALLVARGVRVPGLGAPRPLRRGFTAVASRLVALPPTLRAGILGLGSTLLPCGWLYAFAVVAAGTGSPLGGAAVMALFWAGTVPILAFLGVGVQALAAPLRRQLPTITATLLIVIGAATVFTRLPAIGLTPLVTEAHEETPIPEPEHVDCPCHD